MWYRWLSSITEFKSSKTVIEQEWDTVRQQYTEAFQIVCSYHRNLIHSFSKRCVRHHNKKKIYVLRHNRNFTVKSLTAAKQNLVYLLQNLNLKNTAPMSFQNTVKNVFFAHILLKAEIEDSVPAKAKKLLDREVPKLTTILTWWHCISIFFIYNLCIVICLCKGRNSRVSGKADENNCPEQYLKFIKADMSQPPTSTLLGRIYNSMNKTCSCIIYGMIINSVPIILHHIDAFKKE